MGWRKRTTTLIGGGRGEEQVGAQAGEGVGGKGQWTINSGRIRWKFLWSCMSKSTTVCVCVCVCGKER